MNRSYCHLAHTLITHLSGILLSIMLQPSSQLSKQIFKHPHPLPHKKTILLEFHINYMHSVVAKFPAQFRVYTAITMLLHVTCK